MNRWIVLFGLALICSAQVWGKPADKKSDDVDEYVDDATEDDDNESYVDEASGPIQLITKPKNLVAAPGDDVYLPCEFINIGSIVVSWKRGEEVLFAGTVKVTKDWRIDHMKNNTLVIHKVNESDSSNNYVCEALEAFLDANDRKKVVHTLRVQERPTISAAGGENEVRVTPHKDVDVAEGESVTLGCETNGAQYKARGWSRGGHRLIDVRETAQGVYIDIKNATRHVAGDYQCLVETGAAEPIIKHLKFRVRHVPVVEYEKELHGDGKEHDRTTYYTGVGATTSITCVVHAHPGVTRVQWYKDGNQIKIKNDPRMSKSDEIKTHHVLTIKNTSKSDLGQYSCRASNDLGTGVGPVIRVRDTPDQPIFKKGEPVDDTIVFEWRVVSYKPIVEAELLYRKEGTTEWQKSQKVKVISSIGKEHIIQGTITGIEAGKHEAVLRARNDEEHKEDDRNAEWGPYSEIKKFDGEYKEDNEVASVRGSAMRPTISLMTLLLFVSPLVYSCL